VEIGEKFALPLKMTMKKSLGFGLKNLHQGKSLQDASQAERPTSLL
jgi:hypothetical protein